MNTSEQFCPNETCLARGKRGEGTITIHDRQRQRYRCRSCGRTFSTRRGTMLEGLRKPSELIVIVVTLLASGCPIQAIVHAYELDERTVGSPARSSREALRAGPSGVDRNRKAGSGACASGRDSGENSLYANDKNECVRCAVRWGSRSGSPPRP